MGGDAVLFHQLEEVLGNGQTDLALAFHAAANRVGAGIEDAVFTGGAVLEEQMDHVGGFVQHDVFGLALVKCFHFENPLSGSIWTTFGIQVF